MKVSIFFIILLVIFLVLVGILLFIFKFSEIPPKWPYIFNLKNLGSQGQEVQVSINGNVYKSYKISAGEEVKILVGDNVTNPRTGGPFKYPEVFNVSFNLKENGNIRYDSPNAFKAPAFSSETCTKNCYVSVKRSEDKTFYFFMNEGYYTVFMQ